MKLPRAETRGLRGLVIGDRYQVIRRIGEGGMGAVYELRHQRLGHRFALKTLRSDLVQDPEALARFRREADIIAKLRHPHIVEIIGWELLDDGSPCMIMEYLEGETLAARLKRSGPLGWPELAQIADQVLSALALAHRADIVHRDLTPWNVFLAVDDAGEIRAKLLDFGISKIRSTGTLSTHDESVLGTPAYMSPEQADGQRELVGPASDVWAMGAILFKMATGKAAFSANSVPATLYRICYQEPESLVEHRPDAPPEFVELVGRTLSRDPERRITDADRLREGLRAALTEVAPGAFLAPIRAPARRVALPLEPGPPTGDEARSPSSERPAVESEEEGVSASASARDQPVEPPRRRNPLRWVGAGVVGIAAMVALVLGLVGGASKEGSAPVAAAGASFPDASPRPSPDSAAGALTDARPSPATVTLELDSSPRGADVYREPDGRLVGRTPYREVVARGLGRVVFQVKLKGHRSERVEMTTDADRTELVQLRRTGARTTSRAKPKHREVHKPARKKGEPLSPPF